MEYLIFTDILEHKRLDGAWNQIDAFKNFNSQILMAKEKDFLVPLSI
jgi:hypothetical protein